jgi:hypothetical protein
MATNRFKVNDRVEGGSGDGYDTGRVVDVDGGYVTVAWDSGVLTTIHPDIVRPVGTRGGAK